MRYLKSLPRIVWIPFLVSIFLLILKIFLLDEIPEPIIGFAKLGLIVEAILASIIAATVFYFFVAHIREESERARMKPYIKRWMRVILGSFKHTLALISEASGVKLELGALSRQELDQAFSEIAKQGSGRLDADAEWVRVMSEDVETLPPLVGRLIALSRFLDAESMSVLADIEASTYFSEFYRVWLRLATYGDLPQSCPYVVGEFASYCAKLENIVESKYAGYDTILWNSRPKVINPYN